jgi:hypothetical protein
LDTRDAINPRKAIIVRFLDFSVSVEYGQELIEKVDLLIHDTAGTICSPSASRFPNGDTLKPISNGNLIEQGMKIITINPELESLQLEADFPLLRHSPSFSTTEN